MDAINPPLLPGQTAPCGPAPPTASGSSAAAAATTEGLVVDAPPAAAALGKRKRLGQHVVPAPPAAAAPPAPANRVKQPSSKVPAPAPAQKKAAPKKAAKMPAAAKMASLTALTAEMTKAPPESVHARKVVDESPAVDVALESYVDMLNEASIDICSVPLADYGDYNDGLEEGLEGEEFEEEEDTGGEEEDELEEIEEEAFDGAVAKAKGRAVRPGNYTEFEDVILIRAWEAVSMDAVTGTDQTGKRYWQRIVGKFFQLMPPLSSTPTCSYRSLQGRWDTIKTACSRWDGCVEGVRNAPPSGTNAGDWDAIAQQRFREMPGLKGIPFKFAHCYTLLEHNLKWKLREQEAPPPKHKLVELEDAEEDDVLETKKNKKRPDGAKATKDKIKKQGEAASSSLKIDVMVKSKEVSLMKTLEAKKEMMDANTKEKEAKWTILQEDAKRKADVVERRARAEEHRAMAELIAAENATMMMNPAGMDEASLEWWKLTKTQILARRRKAARAAMAAAMNAGGEDATASGDGHVEAPATDGDT
ncbi:hypothetical protein ACQ4PT_049211 [Festuca glaucescens]